MKLNNFTHFKIYILIFSFTLLSHNSHARNCKKLFAKSPSHSLIELPERGYFSEYEKVPISSEQISISVHTSSAFDHKSTTKKSVVKLNQFIKEKNPDTPSISLVTNFISGKPEGKHYLLKNEIDIPIQSELGHHKLEFKNLQSVILSGGYLKMCLKTAFLDILKGAKKASKQLDFYLITDAIYVSDLSVRALRDQIDSNYQKSRFSSYRQLPLEKALEFMKKRDIVKFLDESLNVSMKKDQLYIEFREDQRYFRGGITINYFHNNKLLASTGHGKRVINLHLTNLKDFKSSM